MKFGNILVLASAIWIFTVLLFLVSYALGEQYVIIAGENCIMDSDNSCVIDFYNPDIITSTSSASSVRQTLHPDTWQQPEVPVFQDVEIVLSSSTGL